MDGQPLDGWIGPDLEPPPQWRIEFHQFNWPILRHRTAVLAAEASRFQIWKFFPYHPSHQILMSPSFELCSLAIQIGETPLAVHGVECVRDAFQGRRHPCGHPFGGGLGLLVLGDVLESSLDPSDHAAFISDPLADGTHPDSPFPSGDEFHFLVEWDPLVQAFLKDFRDLAAPLGCIKSDGLIQVRHRPGRHLMDGTDLV